jgi:hypothetical protein
MVAQIDIKSLRYLELDVLCHCCLIFVTFLVKLVLHEVANLGCCVWRNLTSP